METSVSLKYLVTDCLRKTFFDSGLPQTPSNFFFDNFGNSKVFHTVSA